VNNNFTILQIKQEISVREITEIYAQILLYSGKPLVDDKTILDYGIENNSTLHLVY
jgi:hypothetical protein